jgi:hypothetical protein
VERTDHAGKGTALNLPAFIPERNLFRQTEWWQVAKLSAFPGAGGIAGAATAQAKL